MDHPKIIATLADALRDKPGIRALFLSGSYATGHADAYSDIDFLLVAEDGATDAVAHLWKDAVGLTGEIVLWWDRTTVPVLINAITADWARTDVIILKPEQMKSHTQDKLTPLFDHDGIYEGLPANAPPLTPSAARFTYDVEEFIRILGLLHLVDGRAEYNNGVLGVFHLRNKLVDLLIAETADPVRGGMLHLNRLITQDQKDLLTALPPPGTNRADIIASHLAYAKAYLPRARTYAVTIGAAWPEQFETVTWDMLARTTDITCPYDRTNITAG